MLASANLLAFPMVCALPLRRIAARLAKSGSAVAGYAGADAIRRSNCVILTDTDLFPPGTVSLNGLKIYGEESGKVISYAATMAHASQSGLSRLFDTLLEGEGGRLEPLDDLSFYEEGGVSGLIHGETVIFGTRLALSEKDGEHPYALLYREGLMPYAEIAVGSKRLVHAVRVAAVLSLGSSAVSALLAFYLTFVGAYSALTPVSMLLYLLLWALAALIEGFWADRY